MASLIPDPLTEIQLSILDDIAIKGPMDAYGEHKRIKKGLSTTQNVMKKLSDRGLLKLKEITPGKTDINKKIYCITGLGLCVAAADLLNQHTAISNYEVFHSFILQNSDLFPHLFERWDNIIENTRKCFKKHSILSSFHIDYLISFPDLATETWCAILYRFCQDCIDGNYGEKITPEELHRGFNQRLTDRLLDGYPIPQEVMKCILKEDPSFWSEIRQLLMREFKIYKVRTANLVKILEVDE